MDHGISFIQFGIRDRIILLQRSTPDIYIFHIYLITYFGVIQLLIILLKLLLIYRYILLWLKSIYLAQNENDVVSQVVPLD